MINSMEKGKKYGVMDPNMKEITLKVKSKV